MSATSLSAAASSFPSKAGADRLAEVHKLLRKFPLIDGHNDLPWQYYCQNNELAAIDLATDTSRLKDRLFTDIPRLRAGAFGGQFWAIYVPPTLPGPAAVEAVLKEMDVVHRFTAQHPKDLELALTAADVERIHRQGRIASLIGIEGGHSLNNSLAVLRMTYKLGARYLTLTHTKNTAWADAAGDQAQHHGLTAFGEAVVREMNRLGMMVDLSHVTDDTMRAALKVSQAPIIFSHSCARALCNSPRNVPDDILRETAQKGGVVMVCFLPGFLTERARESMARSDAEKERLKQLYPDTPSAVDEGMDAWRTAHPCPNEASLTDVADHIDHIRKVAGIDHVGLGSDFEGFHGPPDGLEDVSKYPALLAELMRRGYTKEDLKKVAGANLLRVFREVEAVAARLQKSGVCVSQAAPEPRPGPQAQRASH